MEIKFCQLQSCILTCEFSLNVYHFVVYGNSFMNFVDMFYRQKCFPKITAITALNTVKLCYNKYEVKFHSLKQSSHNNQVKDFTCKKIFKSSVELLKLAE